MAARVMWWKYQDENLATVFIVAPKVLPFGREPSQLDVPRNSG